MIKKLRIKFIAAAMLSLTLVLVVILGGVNLLSLQQVVRDADSVLAILSENRGDFPQREFPDGQRQGGDPFGAHTGRYRNLSPETPYETRYFSILLDSSGQVLESDTGQIVAIDDETAAEFAQKVYDSGRTDGFLGEYRYLRSEEDGNIRIIFLDCGRSLTNLRTMLFASILVSLLGLAAVLLLLILFSRRIVRPLAESYEKQRRFITDAGHELKTPLTIIGADTDLAEMELGENEWLADIRRQAERLTGLTNDLIYLSRMEEEQPKLSLIEFPLSDVAEETAQSFLAPARTQGKTLSLAIEPMLSFYGEEKSIRQLLSILLDNA
ncbi:MAG: HAMP domain-containing sensor histidine kinase, partial [Hydrogeniiclostridium sp.]